MVGSSGASGVLNEPGPPEFEAGPTGCIAPRPRPLARPRARGLPLGPPARPGASARDPNVPNPPASLGAPAGRSPAGPVRGHEVEP